MEARTRVPIIPFTFQACFLRQQSTCLGHVQFPAQSPIPSTRLQEGARFDHYPSKEPRRAPGGGGGVPGIHPYGAHDWNVVAGAHTSQLWLEWCCPGRSVEEQEGKHLPYGVLRVGGLSRAHSPKAEAEHRWEGQEMLLQAPKPALQGWGGREGTPIPRNTLLNSLQKTKKQKEPEVPRPSQQVKNYTHPAELRVPAIPEVPVIPTALRHRRKRHQEGPSGTQPCSNPSKAAQSHHSPAPQPPLTLPPTWG